MALMVFTGFLVTGACVWLGGKLPTRVWLNQLLSLIADGRLCVYCTSPTFFQKVIVAFLSSFAYFFFFKEKIEIHFAALLLV